jgi:(1->4)-alpha-D-glucan 1-alpha-D-glucosylmutase
MSITDRESFERLCAESGIVDAYHDIRGVHHVASVDARQALLAAMRIPAETDAQVRSSLEANRRRRWLSTLAPVTVQRSGGDPPGVALTLNEDQVQHPVHWCVHAENGSARRGSWHFDQLRAIEETELDGRRLWRFAATLPAGIDPGYHCLEIQLIDAAASALLIIAPPSCYLPDSIAAGTRSWGVSLQLYALRSQRNWGIGDFTDLKTAIAILAPLGVDCIGLNPLHSLFPQLPENASPYSPSSRDFLNPLYLDIEAIAEFEDSLELRERVGSDSFQARLRALRERQRVDYSGVWAVKREAFALLYCQFQRAAGAAGTARLRQFRDYRAVRGDALFKFALFEALQAYFHEKDGALENWRQWPPEFRDPDSAAVAEWADSHSAAIEFHEYLQWQAEQQLASVQQDCARRGMRIGIYNDLAVGNERFSAQCWADQKHYALNTGIGAPPDDFSPAGQNWGLPPQIPRVLREQGYDPFIRSLRANMRHAGALRIDHVMGLMRLYWVPAGHAANQGTYLRYPFDDLLGIVALESHRNSCLVIGEDLGTVPDEVRHELWVNRILSYRILLFEKDWHAGSFKAPAEYPALALCASGSHDLPTLRGYWRESDLDLRDALELYPNDQIRRQQRDQRRRDRREILAALARENLIDADAWPADECAIDIGKDLLPAVQRFLARSPSCLMMVQIEDLLGQAQQINLPGTIDEYPNWRLKIPLGLEVWNTDGDIERIARVISAERSGQR